MINKIYFLRKKSMGKKSQMDIKNDNERLSQDDSQSINESSLKKRKIKRPLGKDEEFMGHDYKE